MSSTKIEWAQKVWNPVTGCTPISDGCANCYAQRMAHRLQAMGQERYKNGFTVTCHENALDEPDKWKKPSRIFVCSMADLFHEDVPHDFIAEVMSVISLNRQHTFLLLTKRPENVIWHFEKLYYIRFPLPNVWLGVTAENQEQADRRIPILLQIPAAKRFISIEPMLGPVEIDDYFPEYDYRPTYDYYRMAFPDCGDKPILIRPGLDWIICGGESGPGARPVHPDWVRSLRDQCQAAGTPFLFKQWGEWHPLEGTGAAEPTPVCCWNEDTDEWRHGIVSSHGQHMVRIGKKKAGRLLDGKLWDEYPCDA